MYDMNGDGRISIDELDKVVRGSGQNPTTSKLKQMIAEVDADGEYPVFLISRCSCVVY